MSIFTWLAQGLLYIWAESCKKFSERNMNMRESFKMVNFEQDRENTCSFDFLRYNIVADRYTCKYPKRNQFGEPFKF